MTSEKPDHNDLFDSYAEQASPDTRLIIRAIQLQTQTLRFEQRMAAVDIKQQLLELRGAILDLQNTVRDAKRG